MALQEFMVRPAQQEKTAKMVKMDCGERQERTEEMGEMGEMDVMEKTERRGLLDRQDHLEKRKIAIMDTCAHLHCLHQSDGLCRLRSLLTMGAMATGSKRSKCADPEDLHHHPTLMATTHIGDTDTSTNIRAQIVIPRHDVMAIIGTRIMTAIGGARDIGNPGQSIEIENTAAVLHPVQTVPIAPTQIDLEIGKHRNLLDLLLDSLLAHLTIRMTLKIPISGMAIITETHARLRRIRIQKQNNQAQGSSHDYYY